jgi:hypothetical protein
MLPLILLPLFVGSVCAQSIPVLSQVQIQQLEATVAQNPADRPSQALLGQNYSLVILGITSLGQYNTVSSVDPAEARGEFAQHARNVMQNSAFAGVLGEGGEALWNLSFQVEGYEVQNPSEAHVAYFDARALGAQALDRAIVIEPVTAKWRSYRIPILVLRTNSNFLPLSAKDAYSQVKEDLWLLTGTTRYAVLADAAKLAVKGSALDEAQSYAIELLTSATDPKDWNYGNAIFFGNMVQGQVALRRGDLEAARSRLLSSGNTPGSPQLNSFGPNMSLARDLLAGVVEVPSMALARRAAHVPRRNVTSREVRETVLEFFDLCRVFWTMGGDRLDQWSQQVRAGIVPDFGANLYY